MHLCGLLLEELIYSGMCKLCCYLTGLNQMKPPSLQTKLEKEQQAVYPVVSLLKIGHKLMGI